MDYEASLRVPAVILPAVSQVSEPPVLASCVPVRETDVELVTEKRLLLLERLTSLKEVLKVGLVTGLPTGRGQTGEATKRVCPGKGIFGLVRHGFAADSIMYAAGYAYAAMSCSASALRRVPDFQSRRRG